MQDHVHHTDRPHIAFDLLPIQGQVVGVLPLLFNVLVGLDQEATRSHRGVVNFVTCLGLGDLHQQTHHLGGGVELAALLARAVGEELDQVFVGRAQKVREFKVVIDQHKVRLAEVVEQLFPLFIGDLVFAFDGIEVDVAFEHAVERVVFILHRRNGFVEHVANVVFEVFQ